MQVELASCLRSIAAAALCLLPGIAAAEQVTVAVAANFLSPVRALEPAFEAVSGHELLISSGSTGQLYAQIVNGAPFDVLLAADQERPRRLVDEGVADAASVFTYAVGRLALWSAEPERIHELPLAELLAGEYRWLAIAEPAVAPYGAAAQQVLEELGAWGSVQSRLVRGQNIAQTFAMVQTRNAELGLVALSQALTYDGAASYQIVPQALHDPIRQDAVLLQRARDNPAALAWLEYLKSPAAGATIERFGYAVSDDAER
jgi:molybdate transport system substrate-binding protein